jgi:hypothetical protein
MGERKKRTMSQYLLLIYEPKDMRTKGDFEGEGRQMMAEYKTFTDDIVRSGHMRAGNALQSVTTATTVRVRDGKLQRTDGPFAETKETLGGYYLVEAASLEEAQKIAARIPGAKLGSIEVRPIQQMS